MLVIFAIGAEPATCNLQPATCNLKLATYLVLIVVVERFLVHYDDLIASLKFTA